MGFADLGGKGSANEGDDGDRRETHLENVLLSIVDLVEQMNSRWFVCPISEMLHLFYIYDYLSPGN